MYNNPFVLSLSYYYYYHLIVTVYYLLCKSYTKYIVSVNTVVAYNEI